MYRSISVKFLLPFYFVITIVFTSCQHKHCRPIECITKVNCHGDSCERSITQFWIYDQQGRLAIDSINAPDTIFNPHRTLYYQYQGDSIISTGQYADRLVFKINKDGVAVFTGCQVRKKYANFWLPFYNADGTIKKIESGSVSVTGDSALAIIDSIIYFDSNIVAYRSTGVFGLNCTVHCTYYSDKPNIHDFNPTYKILALSNPLGPTFGVFNVQAYSKNLIKDIQCGGRRKSYDYEIDEEGKVMKMKLIDTSDVYVNTNQYTFKYSCR